jgi:hypothetical protein
MRNSQKTQRVIELTGVAVASAIIALVFIGMALALFS